MSIVWHSARSRDAITIFILCDILLCPQGKREHIIIILQSYNNTDLHKHQPHTGPSVPS